MTLHVFGIRHHGPGSARSLVAALEQLEPDIVLVEGPPDAQAALPLLMHAEMQPPVALLVYAPDAPERAAFYPFTSYSPEWQALRYALGRGIPARFIDLPQATRLAEPAAEPGPPEASPAAETAPEADAEQRKLRDDPIGMLAEAAGFQDHELWWELQIEQRVDSRELFTAIMEAMSALRAVAEPPTGREAQREAYMREQIRASQAEGFERIAVVCGAWHAPVLAEPGPPDDDRRLLRGLDRVKVAATWIPWTNGRLAYRSGYGAGVYSPGWYEHLWATPDRSVIRWLSRAAALLRAEDLPAASSNVIEAVRLAETLAALRELPMPGLAELSEAIQAVLCGGEVAPMLLIRQRLEVGEVLGAVPAETPSVPLQADFEAQQRRLRLRPSAERKELDLDLRNENDRERSRLLHRLRLLGVGWGTPQRERRARGTFHELWTLEWQPELSLALIEANVWGNTLEAAAGARLRSQSAAAANVSELVEQLESGVTAGLPAAVDYILHRVREQSALGGDVRWLLDALPVLARVARYGDVRETRAEHVVPVFDTLFERALVGLPGACTAIDDEAGASMGKSLAHAQAGLDTLGGEERQARWHAVLSALVGGESINGYVRGRCCRLLLEHSAVDNDELARIARLALAPVVARETSAAWIQGLVRGSAMVLLQHRGLWQALDGWLSELDEAALVALLPLLRRAFADFAAPERRAMGELVAGLGAGPASAPAAHQGRPLAHERAARVLPVLAALTGRRT